MPTLDSDRVDVKVENGCVMLEGTVEAKTEAQILEDLVAGVDGVISVESSVGYLVDDTHRSDEARPLGVPRPNW